LQENWKNKKRKTGKPKEGSKVSNPVFTKEQKDAIDGKKRDQKGFRPIDLGKQPRQEGEKIKKEGGKSVKKT